MKATAELAATALLLAGQRRPSPAAARRLFSWGLVLSFLIPVGAAVAVACTLTGCAEKATALRQAPPSSEAYPQVEDQCEAQPWLAWCAAEAEKRHT